MACPRPLQYTGVSTTASPVTQVADVAVNRAVMGGAPPPPREAAGIMSSSVPMVIVAAKVTTMYWAGCRSLAPFPPNQRLLMWRQHATSTGPSLRSGCSTGPGAQMHVIVVGCGRVGSELAGTLEQGGHTVAVLDKREGAFRRLPKHFSGTTVVGFGFDRDHLRECGVEEAGALAAVTNGDNSNILTARIARENFGIERVVARIYDSRRAVIYQRLGIHTVATVSWTGDQVLRRLLPDEERADWVDATGKVCVVERELPLHWAGRKLGGLNEPGQFWITACNRLGMARIVTSDVVGQEGDVLVFMAATDALDALRERLAHQDGH